MLGRLARGLALAALATMFVVWAIGVIKNETQAAPEQPIERMYS